MNIKNISKTELKWWLLLFSSCNITPHQHLGHSWKSLRDRTLPNLCARYFRPNRSALIHWTPLIQRWGHWPGLVGKSPSPTEESVPPIFSQNLSLAPFSCFLLTPCSSILVWHCHHQHAQKVHCARPSPLTQQPCGVPYPETSPRPLPVLLSCPTTPSPATMGLSQALLRQLPNETASVSGYALRNQFTPWFIVRLTGIQLECVLHFNTSCGRVQKWRMQERKEGRKEVKNEVTSMETASFCFPARKCWLAQCWMLPKVSFHSQQSIVT